MNICPFFASILTYFHITRVHIWHTNNTFGKLRCFPVKWARSLLPTPSITFTVNGGVVHGRGFESWPPKINIRLYIVSCLHPMETSVSSVKSVNVLHRHYHPIETSVSTVESYRLYHPIETSLSSDETVNVLFRHYHPIETSVSTVESVDILYRLYHPIETSLSSDETVNVLFRHYHPTETSDS
jgi:hypothetical protein